MKTIFRTAAAALALLFGLQAVAQNSLCLDNTFIQAGTGINTMYVHSHGSYDPLPAVAYDLSAGKWFSPSLGVRVGAFGGGLREYGLKPTDGTSFVEAGEKGFKISQSFDYAHADLLWNATNSIFGYDPDRLVSVSPYMMIGAIGVFTGGSLRNKEIAAGAGLLASFDFGGRLGAYLDLRALSYHASHVGNAYDGRVVNPSLLAGVQYSLGQSGWDYSEGSLYDHSFIQAGYGALNIRGVEGLSPAFELAFGRWLSPTFGGRVGWQQADGFKYAHGDFLWNLANFAFGEDDRFWSPVPYAGAGALHTPKSIVEFALGAGLLNNFRFSRRIGAYVDLRADAFSGRALGRTGGIALAASASAGLQLAIGGTDWKMETIGEPRERKERDVLNGVFINYGGGINTLYSTLRGFEWYTGYAPSIELELGKWFNPYIGARVGGQGIRLSKPAAAGGETRTGFAYGHVDLLWNATNNIFGYKGAQHLVSVSPYAHMGMLMEYHGISDKEFAAGAGILSTLNLTDRAGIFADLRTFVYKGQLRNRTVNTPSFAASALAGITYNLGEHDWMSTRSSFLDNTFVAGGAGANLVFQRGSLAPSFEVSAGKWLTPYIGGRFGWKGGNMESSGSKIGFNYFHGDFLWDATAAAFGEDGSRFLTVAPYASLGVVRGLNIASDRTPMSTEYAAGAGLYNLFRLTDRVDAYLDLSALLLNSRTPRAKFGHYPIDLLATVGLAYNVGQHSWKESAMSLDRQWFTPKEKERRGEWIISDHFVDNTFVTMTGGLNTIYAPGEGKGFNGGYAPAMDLTLGMWFNPTFAGRIGAQGLNAAVFSQNARGGVFEASTTDGSTLLETSFVYLHGDLLWNFNNAVAGYRKDRAWSLIPYGTAGFFVSSPLETAEAGHRYRLDVAAGPGLINRFRLAERVSFDVDMRTLLVGSRNYPSEDLHKFILGSAMVGLTYDIGRPDWVSSLAKFAEPVDGHRRDAHGYVANTGFFDNTFVTASAGANFILKGDKARGEAVEIAAGKWFSPYFGGRVAIQGDRLGNNKDFAYTHLDLLADAGSILLGYDPDRNFTIQPYASIGIERSGNYSTPVKAGAGAIAAFRLDSRLSMNVEGRAILLGRSTLAGAAMFGMNYAIGAPDWKRAEVNGAEPDSLRNYAKFWALSTNLVDYADGTFNLEAQYALGRHWSLDARIGSNTHTWGFGDTQDQKQYFALGARLWPWYTYSGVWFRADAQIESYHASGYPRGFNALVSDRNVPEIGDAYGAGLSLGYSWMIARWFNLDFGVGGWGGVKNFAQYEDASFSKRITSETSTKGFVSLNNITISAMFVF